MHVPESVLSKYRLIVLAGQRVAQLQKGAKPRVEATEKEKSTTIATREVSAGKITYSLSKDHEDASDS